MFSKFLARVVSTLFYSGFFTKMPGTIGTLFSFLIILPAIIMQSFYGCIVAFCIVTLLGFVFIPIYLETSKEDKQEIVIDEASGFYISIIIAISIFMFLKVNFNWNILSVICFVFFRIFDIKKPLFVKTFDNMKGTFGIMMDDISAGLCAGIASALLYFIILL